MDRRRFLAYMIEADSLSRSLLEVLPMRARPSILFFVGILSLSLLIIGFSPEAATGGDNDKNAHWTQKHIRKVPPMMMYEPFFLEVFEQTDRAVPYTYEETVKLAGHSCGATAGGWLITKRALEVLYPDAELPVRGNIRVYPPGAEDEWNVGVIGEVISYLTGAAPKTGFSGAEFGNGFPLPPNLGVHPGDQVFKRRNKMIYPATATGETPPNQPFVDWKFERIDTETEVCVRFMVGGPNGIQPPATPADRLTGAKVASGLATLEETAAYAGWWNQRIEYLFENEETLVFECPVGVRGWKF